MKVNFFKFVVSIKWSRKINYFVVNFFSLLDGFYDVSCLINCLTEEIPHHPCIAWNLKKMRFSKINNTFFTESWLEGRPSKFLNYGSQIAISAFLNYVFSLLWVYSLCLFHYLCLYFFYVMSQSRNKSLKVRVSNFVTGIYLLIFISFMSL